MGIIIQFLAHQEKREMVCMLKKILDILEENKKDAHKYSMDEVDEIADKILENVDYYPISGATPIVRIAKEFDLFTFKANLQEGLSGGVLADGDNTDYTKSKYNHDKVILLNKDDTLFHQRFVIAHELGHFLFDYYGNEEYNNIFVPYSNTYMKDRHWNLSEKIANRFAAEILMPKKLFVQQYNIAKGVDNRKVFVLRYLSKFFEVTTDSIEKRIQEVAIFD